VLYNLEEEEGIRREEALCSVVEKRGERGGL